MMRSKDSPGYINSDEVAYEITRSKNTYCWFAWSELTDHDAITEDPLSAFPTENLPPGYVLRVHENGWIPRCLRNRTGPDGVMRPVELPIVVNFPPFQHWMWTGEDWLLVARSHWRISKDAASGDADGSRLLPEGEFCQTHGRSTDKLGAFYLRLVEKYGQRANFRNYTYLDEMKAVAIQGLVQNGLKFHEARAQYPTKPFGYLTQIMHNCFVQVLNKEKKQRDLIQIMRRQTGLDDTFSAQAEQELRRYNDLAGVSGAAPVRKKLLTFPSVR